MTTTNLISTPNIVGNIGSCTTQSTQVIENSNFVHDVGYIITTNSCTGEVTKYNYHSLNGGAFALSIGAFILIFMFLLAWGNRETNNI